LTGHCVRTHTHTHRQTSNERIISAIHFVHFAEIVTATYIWVGCPRLSRILLQPRDDGTLTGGTTGACWVVLDRSRPCKKLGSV